MYHKWQLMSSISANGNIPRKKHIGVYYLYVSILNSGEKACFQLNIKILFLMPVIILKYSLESSFAIVLKTAI